MWSYHEYSVSKEDTVAGIKVILKTPKSTLVQDKVISDREMINLLVLWVGDAKAHIDYIRADEDEVEELLAEGRYIDPNDKYRIYGYSIDWIIGKVHNRYFLEDLGPDNDDEFEEEECEETTEEVKKGIFSRLFNRR